MKKTIKQMKKVFLTSFSAILFSVNMQHYAFSSEWIKKQENKTDVEKIIKQIHDIKYIEKLETNNKSSKDSKGFILKEKTKYGDLIIKENVNNPYYYNVILKDIPKKICQKIISDEQIKKQAKFIQLSNIGLDVESKMKETFITNKEICYQKTEITLAFNKE